MHLPFYSSPTHPPAHLSTHPRIYPSFHPHIHPRTHQSTHPSIAPSVYPHTHPRVHSFMDLSLSHPPPLPSCIQTIWAALVRSDRLIPWHRARLILLGEGGAGKTCFVRALSNKVFLDTASTAGVDTATLEAIALHGWKHVPGSDYEKVTSRIIPKRSGTADLVLLLCCVIHSCTHA